MAAEAVTLGVPAVLINSLQVGYCIEAEKAGMLFSFPCFNSAAVNKIDELLNTPNIRQAFKARHAAYLAGKIDVTAFMVWLIEAYPESLAILRNDPDYAGKFV